MEDKAPYGKPERASEEHERNFRATYELRGELADEPYWQAAYEYAAQYKVTVDEMNALGSVLVRKQEETPKPIKSAEPLSQSEMSAEECAAEFRRRKYKGRDDWRPWARDTWVVTDHPGFGLHIEDARALCLGWKAQDEMADSQARYRDIQRCADEANASVFTLQARLALLTEENARLRSEPAPTGVAEGTWPWALEQMKAGKRVRHSTMIDGGAVWIDPNGFVDWMPDNEDDKPEDYGDNFLFDWQDFTRTDWELSPTEGK